MRRTFWTPTAVASSRVDSGAVFEAACSRQNVGRPLPHRRFDGDVWGQPRSCPVRVKQPASNAASRPLVCRFGGLAPHRPRDGCGAAQRSPRTDGFGTIRCVQPFASRRASRGRKRTARSWSRESPRQLRMRWRYGERVASVSTARPHGEVNDGIGDGESECIVVPRVPWRNPTVG